VKIAIVTSPRSGSTWLYKILHTYLKQNVPNLLALEEYFNVEQLQGVFVPGEKTDSSDMTIFSLRYPEEPPTNGYQSTFCWGETGIEKAFVPFTKEMIQEVRNMFGTGAWEKYKTEESKKRLDWLHKSDRSILLKVMAKDLDDNPDLADYLSKNFKVIFLKRENLVNQIQSYCLSMASGVWHSLEVALDKVNHRAFVCERSWVDLIMDHLSSYSKWAEEMKPNDRQSVTYEQLCSWKHPEVILENFGLTPGKSLSQELAAQAKSPVEFQYFSNREQFLGWITENKIAIITDSDSSKLYSVLLQHLRQKDPDALSLENHFNIQNLRFNPEMTKKVQFMAQMGAWGEYRFVESKKRLTQLKENPAKNILLTVSTSDFEDNPDLAKFLYENYKLIFLKAGEWPNSELFKYLRKQHSREVTPEQLNNWRGSETILKNLGFNLVQPGVSLQ
jgi:LPS sulfotransferase NodH